MTDYASISYWDERYSSEDTTFDWYQDFKSLNDHILPFLKVAEDFEILIPGCGNSKLGADLYDAGYHNITNIDTSAVVIAQMNDRYAHKDDMEFTVMDARNMEFLPNNCFDVILDKGMLDCFLCSATNNKDVISYLREMSRILKSNGKLIIVSHGRPVENGRLEYLQKCVGVNVWSNIEHREIPKTPVQGVQEEEGEQDHYMYICTKQAGGAGSIASSSVLTSN